MTTSQLARRIANGDTKTNTLVWKPGMKGWQPLKDVPELSSLLTPATPKPPPLPQAKPTTIYFLGVGGQRQGPFTYQQVMDKLSSGEISSDTLVWKKGMSRWQRLATLEEFVPKMQNVSQDGLPSSAAELRKFMEGTWREVIMDTPEAKYVIEMTFHADGTARLHELNQNAGEPPDEAIMNLYWRVVPGSARDFQLIVGDNQNSPLEDSMVSRLEYVDHNHLRDEDGSLMERVQ